MLYQNGAGEAVDCGAGFGYAAELKYFIDCVSRGEKPSIVTADDGVRSVRIVEAEVKSARSGGEIVKL